MMPPPLTNLSDEVLERREGRALVDLLGLALDGGPDAVGREEDHGLLLAAEGGVGDDEGQGGLVAVGPAVLEGDAEFVAHGWSFRALIV